MFRIYYSAALVEGRAVDDWIVAPLDDVQVVAVRGSPSYPLPGKETGYVHCVTRGWMLYTGVDEFDPLQTGYPKRGRLLSDEAYFTIWRRAYGDANA